VGELILPDYINFVGARTRAGYVVLNAGYDLQTLHRHAWP
jgi:hypothetical protein